MPIITLILRPVFLRYTYLYNNWCWIRTTREKGEGQRSKLRDAWVRIMSSSTNPTHIHTARIGYLQYSNTTSYCFMLHPILVKIAPPPHDNIFTSHAACTHRWASYQRLRTGGQQTSVYASVANIPAYMHRRASYQHKCIGGQHTSIYT